MAAMASDLSRCMFLNLLWSQFTYDFIVILKKEVQELILVCRIKPVVK